MQFVVPASPGRAVDRNLVWSRMRFIVATLVVIPACVAQPEVGVAYVRLTESTGTCGISVPTDQSDPMAVDKMIRDLTSAEFRGIHAQAAFEGGSQWEGGNLIAIPWIDPDGTIGRFFVDVGPDRGYGITIFSSTASVLGPEYEEATGLVQWNGTTRVFAGQAAHGVINYTQDAAHKPRELFALLAFDGIGPAGEPLCRMVGLHGNRSHDRFERYDPSWMAAAPSLLITACMAASCPAAPTFSDEHAPNSDLVDPVGAGADPEGAPPSVEQRAPYYLSNGGSAEGACD